MFSIMEHRTAHVGKRGTIVIPAAMRNRLGMSEGALVIIEGDDESVVIRPARATVSDAAWRRTFVEQTNAAYASLRADRRAWAEIEGDREPWDATLSDGLSDEPWVEVPEPEGPR